ncbi:RNA polymerase sigma factor SigA [Planctomycetes bacterium Pla163]|uniref:RNA polymerase sigma factor SigA n=1 Tax=Rohdeia mirabilis TaxID=2528008 RepID=A0A518D429_9BACT|nr:RNA polymerase sigma factor SigA [Planctomycetes bacterium Pla163]
MNTKLLRLEDLDRHLDELAQDHESFAESCRELGRALDAEGVDLELPDPRTWRGQQTPGEASVDPLRLAIDAIVLQDRESEAKLARRIEFARFRFEARRTELELDDDEFYADPGPLARRWEQMSANDHGEFEHLDLMRRAAEWHALRTELVERNLYLVPINVERYVHGPSIKTDLMQEGFTVLYRAVDGFDWRRELLFRTYAVHWLNQAFRSYLYNHGSTVRVPVYLQKAMKQVNQARYRLGDMDADPMRIAEETDLPEHIVAAAISASRSNISLDLDLTRDGDGNRLVDLLSAEDEDGDPYSVELEDITLEDGLGRALADLDERESKIVRLRFGLGGVREHTLAEVAKLLGVSVERVRQIQVRALRKLDTPSLRRELDPYLN